MKIPHVLQVAFSLSLVTSTALFFSACQEEAAKKTETVKVEAPVAEAAAPTPAPQANPHLEHGKTLYKQVCFACHDQGIAGAPTLGDATLWGPRIAQGRDTLVAHAINGFTGQTGVMPAKGGNAALTDAEIGHIVDYMMSLVK